MVKTLQTSRLTFFNWAKKIKPFCVQSIQPHQPASQNFGKKSTQNTKPRNWIPIHVLALKVIFTPTCFFFLRQAHDLWRQIVGKAKTSPKETDGGLYIKENTHGCDVFVGYVLFIFVSCLVSLRILCLASKKAVGMIHNPLTANSKPTNNHQPPQLTFQNINLTRVKC